MWDGMGGVVTVMTHDCDAPLLHPLTADGCNAVLHNPWSNREQGVVTIQGERERREEGGEGVSTVEQPHCVWPTG